MSNTENMIYLIQINDVQRAALLEVLRAAKVGGSDDEEHPLQYWVAMLEGLPKEEVEVRKQLKVSGPIIHGFCL